MLDRAKASDKFTQRKFAEAIRKFSEGCSACEHQVRERMDSVRGTMNEARGDLTRSSAAKTAALEKVFRRHVTDLSSLRRSGMDQARLFRRGMFAFEERFNIEVLNMHARMWGAVNAQWEKEKAIQRLLRDSIALKHVDQVSWPCLNREMPLEMIMLTLFLLLSFSVSCSSGAGSGQQRGSLRRKRSW
jgi:hypothetical protein